MIAILVLRARSETFYHSDSLKAIRAISIRADGFQAVAVVEALASGTQD
ncbi:MAG: hypothetical protein R6U93_01520 [Dehalococcoidia bacterium]